MSNRAIIFVNGDLPNLDAARKLLRNDDYIIAADGGTRHALNLGLVPSVIIGDLDSLGSVKLPKSAEILQFPEDKDETDLELALIHARKLGFDEVLLIGGLGGRIDQTLGNLSLLTDPALANINVRLDDGIEEAFFTKEKAEIIGNIGDTVSLIPWGNDVVIHQTEGLRWHLQNETLYSYKTRGVSNELTAEKTTVEIEDGLLLIIHTR